MTNTNKRGYSTKDVAQVLGVHYVTVRKMVDAGRLECLMDPPVTPGGKRKIRFTREHIANYLREHREHYDEATLKAWGVTETAATTGTAEIAAVPDPIKEETPSAAKAETYYIFVDGRLCLGNMSSETARTILCALMTDENFGYHQITIKRM